MLCLCAEKDILRNEIACLKLPIHNYMKTTEFYFIKLIDSQILENIVNVIQQIFTPK